MKRPPPRKKKRPSRRRAQRPIRIRPVVHPVIGKLAKLFTPKPYDEGEAVMDALGGRSACRHGQWPHQDAICALCVAEVSAKAVMKFFEVKP